MYWQKSILRCNSKWTEMQFTKISNFIMEAWNSSLIWAKKISQHYVLNSLFKYGMFRQEVTVYTPPTSLQVSRKSHGSYVAHALHNCLSNDERANSINCLKKNYIQHQNEFLTLRYNDDAVKVCNVVGKKPNQILENICIEVHSYYTMLKESHY